MKTVTIQEAQEKLPELLEMVAKGESVLISTPDGKVAGVIEPSFMHGSDIPIKNGKRQFGQLRDKIRFKDGWDEPIEDFKDLL